MVCVYLFAKCMTRCNIVRRNKRRFFERCERRQLEIQWRGNKITKLEFLENEKTLFKVRKNCKNVNKIKLTFLFTYEHENIFRSIPTLLLGIFLRAIQTAVCYTCTWASFFCKKDEVTSAQ